MTTLRRPTSRALVCVALALVGAFPLLHVLSHAACGDDAHRIAECRICATLLGAEHTPTVVSIGVTRLIPSDSSQPETPPIVQSDVGFCGYPRGPPALPV